MELVSPPSDLFQPVLTASAGAGDIGIAGPLFFTHRHKGPHVLGLEAERKIPMPVQTYDWGGRYRARFFQGTRVVLDRTIGDSPSPWWNGDRSGLDLLFYCSPGDVPFWPELALDISLLEAGPRSGWPYGKATWYVRRISQK